MIHEQGAQYSGEEILVSLRGGQVGYGTAPMDVVLHNIGGFNNLLYRVSEWKGKFAFRSRGLPPNEIIKAVQARVTQPTRGSYRFTIKLLKPAQLNLFDPPAVIPEEVSDALMSVVTITSSGASEELKSYVPEPQYRNAMVKLIRNIVPAGSTVEELELTRLSGRTQGARQSVLLVPDTRQNVGRVIEATQKPTVARSFTQQGVLRALHLDRKWLKITTETGEHLRFQTQDDVLDDVVGPMVNRQVIVRGHFAGRSNKMHLDDIELNEKK